MYAVVTRYVHVHQSAIGYLPQLVGNVFTLFNN